MFENGRVAEKTWWLKEVTGPYKKHRNNIVKRNSKVIVTDLDKMDMRKQYIEEPFNDHSPDVQTKEVATWPDITLEKIELSIKDWKIDWTRWNTEWGNKALRKFRQEISPLSYNIFIIFIGIKCNQQDCMEYFWRGANKKGSSTVFSIEHWTIFNVGAKLMASVLIIWGFRMTRY